MKIKGYQVGVAFRDGTVTATYLCVARNFIEALALARRAADAAQPGAIHGVAIAALLPERAVYMAKPYKPSNVISMIRRMVNYECS